MNKTLNRRAVYLTIVLGACFGLGITGIFTGNENGNTAFEILRKCFTALPVAAAFLTRRITKDKSPWNFSLKVWKRPGLWLFCAFVPSALIALGAVLYFLIFPGEYSGIFHYGELLGTAGEMQISSSAVFIAVNILISALFIPIQLLELGEEIGWREYLLPRQIKRYGVRKAVLLNSFLWGMAHLPLIYFGFNYSAETPFAPWSSMAMMTLVCMTLGIIFSYVTIISGNCMYCAVIHGAVNVIGEIPVLLMADGKLGNSGLLGPNPTGLISMLPLIVLAAVMFVRLDKIENKLKLAE